MGFHHSSMPRIAGDGGLASPFVAKLLNSHCIEGVGCFEPFFVGVHRNGARRSSHLGVEVSSISDLVHCDDMVPVQIEGDDDGRVLSPPRRPLLGYD